MSCSLVAWEEELSMLLAVSCDECGACNFNKRASCVLLFRRQNTRLWLLASMRQSKESSGPARGPAERCGELPRGHGKSEMDMEVE